MLDDEDPASRVKLARLAVVTRRVDPALLHGTEPGREGDGAVAIAPGARLLDGEAVAVEADPRLCQGKTDRPSARSSHGRLESLCKVEATGETGSNLAESRPWHGDGMKTPVKAGGAACRNPSGDRQATNGCPSAGWRESDRGDKRLTSTTSG
jgi:hypothetical protein